MGSVKYGSLYNYQVHKIIFTFPSYLLPTPCSLLPTPYSLLPTP
ncbi:MULTISPECIES: hypothetical protein [unclassified Moorena]|nr:MULTISPECIES: hypothetical protein [unclassified Moorena]